MNWLTAAILSYFFFALVSLFDRYFLVGPIPNPFAYTFYNGILGLLVSPFLIPFGVKFKSYGILFLGLATGFVRIFAILFLNKAIFESEISRVVPAVGALLPIFSFFFFSIFLPQPEAFTFLSLFSFLLLLFGSFFISKKEFSLKVFNLKILKIPAISAFLFSFHFFLMKLLFSKTNFIDGLFSILVGGGMGAIIFLFFKKAKEEIFSQRIAPKISAIFILGQAFGGFAAFFQFYSLFLANPYQVPLINALEGIRYLFLLFFVFLLSFLKPKILKEEMKGTIFFQKIIATILIAAGLAILAFKK